MAGADPPPERASLCIAGAVCIGSAGAETWDSILGLTVRTSVWTGAALGAGGAGRVVGGVVTAEAEEVGAGARVSAGVIRVG